MTHFWEYVDKQNDDECWLWKGYCDKLGYGTYWGGATIYLAHRYSYALHNGHTPEHLLVCHSCDNPSCVNPLHLFLGTDDDNIKDMIRKGRAYHPSHPSCWRKLTEDDVREIRQLREQGTPLDEIAKRFDVSRPTASRVVLRTTYKKVV